MFRKPFPQEETRGITYLSNLVGSFLRMHNYFCSSERFLRGDHPTHTKKKNEKKRKENRSSGASKEPEPFFFMKPWTQISTAVMNCVIIQVAEICPIYPLGKFWQMDDKTCWLSFRCRDYRTQCMFPAEQVAPTVKNKR